MNVLVIGGTQFIGRALTSQLLQAGHRVTHFNRGTRGEVFPGVETRVGDRKVSLEALDGGSWDAVIDTCGYIPEDVAMATTKLVGRVGTYLFISTISVYPFDEVIEWNEDSRVWDTSGPIERVVNGETYGPLKVLCEKEVEATFGARALIVRPGLVVGPYDPSDRFPYWPTRLSQEEAVVAPIGPDLKTQFVDVDDLAGFCIRLLESGASGTYNANGEVVTFGGLLAECKKVTGSSAEIVWADERWLGEHGVGPGDLPLWFGPEFATGLAKAQAAGLQTTPLPVIVEKAWEWASERGNDYVLSRGPSVERGRELVSAWKNSQR